ncbi:hypothetical protein [Tardiphaga sp.]|uniref:hypothetical protein n=1 Tax=Tardiphaga sp. TaxID=1926292 RepID=UPI00260253E9|nr:hypothetical protein [Tardiphaga sp.]
MSPVYFDLFLFCLFNVAKGSGAKTALPTKEAVGRHGSGKNKLFRFVREAQVVAEEIARVSLDRTTITSQEREVTLASFKNYRLLEDSQLRLRPDNIRARKGCGIGGIRSHSHH